jgi:DNA replication initiation complex subunit (GINS family)
MDIEEIRAARARERDAASLVQLAEPTIFERVQDAVDDEDVDVDDAVQLTTELADERAGKLLKLASFQAAGMAVNWDGVTDQERALVEDLVARLEEWRDSVTPDVEDSNG